jgi:transposase
MHHEQTDREIARRWAMVEAVRRGRSQQQVARDFGVSPDTVNRWVRHAQGQRLDRVDWSDRSRVPYTTQNRPFVL